VIRLLLLSLASFALAAPAFACKCAVRPFDEAAADVESLVEGRAGKPIVNMRDGVGRAYARLRIAKRLKGPRLGRWVTVWTQASSAACGYMFQPGMRVTFGLNRQEDGRWTTNSCVMNSLNQPR
jgi:hypothetical protein